jgi:RNA polymerase sigma factor (sigma-70 family)
MDGESSDEALMLAYRDGDSRAFESLYTRHKAPLYRYLVRQCREPAVAEELFQDVWMNLIRARTRYEVQARFTTYLYRMAHNRLIDHYRRGRSGVPLSYDDDPDDPLMERIAGPDAMQPDVQTDRARDVQRLFALLAELPEAQREAFLLREEAGLTLEQIAEATGVPPETTKSRLRYAVAKLRQGMETEA